jgi:hypothetical protein
MSHACNSKRLLSILAATAVWVASTSTARAAGDRYEPDDTPSKAKVINQGQTQTRSIHAAGNVDWVKFTVPSTSTVVIDTNGTSGDTEMWLYGPNSSTVLAPSPNYSDDAHGLWAKIDLPATNVLARGTYYV